MTIKNNPSILFVCGARPNFMKVAPLIAAARARHLSSIRLVHTGQHYDRTMSGRFFDELALPEPDVNLGVGSGSHAAQTAEIMLRFEPVCMDYQPDWTVVVGDVNSTLACALVAAKLGKRVAHVEAGLRSFDRTMPEEINRTLTDAVSDLLFATEPGAVQNLRREGIDEEKTHLVGNVMIDTLLGLRPRAEQSDILRRLEMAHGQYTVVTLHRPSNVDDPDVLTAPLIALDAIARDLPVIFPLHPRTRANLNANGLSNRLAANTRIRLIDPLGYLDFIKLISSAAIVLTDSGGIQEETSILGVPCLTLRQNTERPITIEEGTNRLVGTDPRRIVEAYHAVRANPPTPNRSLPYWDGQAAHRIIDVLMNQADP